MRDALAISVGSFPGATTALAELAAATGLVHHITIAGQLRAGDVQAQFALDLLRRRAVRLLVLGGWSRAYVPFIDAAARVGVSVAVYWTSTAAQSEIGRELDRLDATLHDARITHHWFVQRALAEALTPHAAGCAWLPALVSAVVGARLTSKPPTTPVRTRGPFHLGLFCSPHEYHRKNVLNTLAALSMSRHRFRLHLNGLTADRWYRAWLDRLSIDYVDHGWMPRDTYLQAVADLDLGLQVSFAESFNYVAVDHLLAGVPIVVSPMVPAVGELPLALRTPFSVTNADDPTALALTIDRLLAAPARARQQTARLRGALIINQRTQRAHAMRLLRKALARA